MVYHNHELRLGNSYQGIWLGWGASWSIVRRHVAKGQSASGKSLFTTTVMKLHGYPLLAEQRQ